MEEGGTKESGLGKDRDWEGRGEGMLKSEKERKQPPQKPHAKASGNKTEHVCQYVYLTC